MLNYDQLKENFIKWANTCNDIRAVIQVGSRARVDHPGDERASNIEWIKNIENPLIVVPYTTVSGKPLQTAIFEDEKVSNIINTMYEEHKKNM